MQRKAFWEKSLFSRCPPSLSLPSYFLSFIQILGLVLRRAPGAGGRVGAQGARSRKSRSACILCDIQIQIQIHQKENSLYACILWWQAVQRVHWGTARREQSVFFVTCCILCDRRYIEVLGGYTGFIQTHQEENSLYACILCDNLYRGLRYIEVQQDESILYSLWQAVPRYRGYSEVPARGEGPVFFVTRSK